MIEDKNTEIILCSNIHIDKNYDNVLDVSKSTLVGYLRGFIDELLAKYGNLDGKIAKTVLQIKKEEKEIKEKGRL